jgi:hypothetical protein
MKDLGLLIKNIEDRARNLKVKLLRYESENSRLADEKVRLQAIIGQQDAQIRQLEEKIKMLKIAQGLGKGKDTTRAKLKINELIREVDKCINLLNK